jgi:hypothetical protein
MEEREEVLEEEAKSARDEVTLRTGVRTNQNVSLFLLYYIGCTKEVSSEADSLSHLFAIVLFV